jgi:hypothetical protein
MTFLYKKEQNGIFYPSEKVLAFQGGDIIFYAPGYVANEIWNRANERYEFISDEPKVFVRGRVEFFHLIFDTFSIILQEFYKNKDTLFIINLEHTNTVTEPAWHLFIKLLENKGVKFITVQISMERPLLINNFKYFKEYPLLVSSVHNISKELSPFLSNDPATRKVFLSRKKFKTNRSKEAFFANENPSNFNFQDDERLDDEDLLANYFISMGFEVVYPEDFTNMEDQIKFFSTVKTIASVTSAAIVNCVFMPKNSKVIELTVPLVVGGTESVHDVYHGISFAKFHKYVSIPSMRKSKDLIDIIESDSDLKRFISE